MKYTPCFTVKLHTFVDHQKKNTTEPVRPHPPVQAANLQKCLYFTDCAFSNISKLSHERMHIGCICLTFLHCVFCQLCLQIGRMKGFTAGPCAGSWCGQILVFFPYWFYLLDFSPLCVFQCVLKLDGWRIQSRPLCRQLMWTTARETGSCGRQLFFGSGQLLVGQPAWAAHDFQKTGKTAHNILNAR